MKIKSVLIALIVTFSTTIGIHAAVFEDGGSYTLGVAIPGDSSTLLDVNEYQNGNISLDQNITNSPGTHLNVTETANLKNLSLYNLSTFNISGGYVEFINFNNNSINYVNGGLITMANLFGNSMEMNAGVVENFNVIGSTINIGGGEANSMWIESGGNCNMNGGLLQGVNLMDTSSLTIHGGTTRDISVGYDATLTIYGDNFQIGGVDVDFGDLTLDYLSNFDNENNNWTLTGTLEDGTDFSETIRISRFGSNKGLTLIQAVPEPGMLLLISFGGMAILNRRKQQ